MTLEYERHSLHDITEHPGLNTELNSASYDSSHHLTPEHGLRRNYVRVSHGSKSKRMDYELFI